MNTLYKANHYCTAVNYIWVASPFPQVKFVVQQVIPAHTLEKWVFFDLNPAKSLSAVKLQELKTGIRLSIDNNQKNMQQKCL